MEKSGRYLFILFLALAISPQAKADDAEAMRILEDTAEFMSRLDRFSYKTDSVRQVVDNSGQKLEFHAEGDVVVDKPGQVRVRRVGEMGRETTLTYDRGNLTLFGSDQGFYATTQVPSNLEQAIPYLREKFNLDLPGADLLLMGSLTRAKGLIRSGTYLGECTLNGKRCHHLAFQAKGKDFQVWVARDGKPVPLRYVITSKDIKGSPEFSVNFRDWDFSPSISKKTFAFTPPSDATKIPLASFKERSKGGLKT